MPVKTFSVSPKASKNANKFPSKIHRKIDRAFEILKQNPLTGEKLRGKLADYYKYRIGDYRIVYRFDAKKSTLLVVKIEHRQGVYR